MSKIYLKKEEFLKHIRESKELGYPTEELAKDWIKLIDKIQSSKHFSSYRKDILEEMKSECLLVMVKKFKLFDCDRCTSPFCYFTRLVFNTSFTVFRRYEKYWKIKEKLNNDYVNKCDFIIDKNRYERHTFDKGDDDNA
jgi:CTP:phosphocholine cytidylyltransferase-like protein